jgi:hypothetical protein
MLVGPALCGSPSRVLRERLRASAARGHSWCEIANTVADLGRE